MSSRIVTINMCCTWDVPLFPFCELCPCGCSLIAARYCDSKCMTTVTLLGMADVTSLTSSSLLFFSHSFFHKSSDLVSSFCLAGDTAANGMSSLTKLSH